MLLAAEVPAAEKKEKRIQKENDFWLHIVLCTVALGLACLEIAVRPHYMQPDGISYLYMKDALLSGDWGNFLNLYWSPLYPALLALGFAFLNPSPYWEFAAVKGVNLFNFLIGMYCYYFLLCEIKLLLRKQQVDERRANALSHPVWLWIPFAYLLFIWAAVHWVRLTEPTGDMLAMAMVFLMSAFILRLKRTEAGAGAYIFLGLSWGIAYLSKAAMLPIGALYMISGLMVARPRTELLKKLCLVLSAFLLTAGPWILAISVFKGGLTAGEAGRLVYSKVVISGPKSDNWQAFRTNEKGDFVGNCKLLSEKPRVYQISGHPKSSYLPWFQPMRWHAAAAGKFSVSGQWEALRKNTSKLAEIKRPNRTVLIWGFILLVLLGAAVKGGLRGLGDFGWILFPSLGGWAVFLLIWISTRYVAPFLPLVWLALYMGIRMPDLKQVRIMRNLIMITVLFFIAAPMANIGIKRVNRILSYDEIGGRHEHGLIAGHLNSLGLKAGDAIAIVGSPDKVLFARIGRWRTVAELDLRDQKEFWDPAGSGYETALGAFKESGAKALVTGNRNALKFQGWKKINHTNYYVYDLRI